MNENQMKLLRQKNGEAVSKRQVQVPVRWQSDPDHPVTHLAYITDAERELLANLDMHGSGVSMDNPHYGPKGIPSLNGAGDRSGGYGGADNDPGSRGGSMGDRASSASSGRGSTGQGGSTGGRGGDGTGNSGSRGNTGGASSSAGGGDRGGNDRGGGDRAGGNTGGGASRGGSANDGFGGSDRGMAGGNAGMGPGGGMGPTSGSGYGGAGSTTSNAAGKADRGAAPPGGSAGMGPGGGMGPVSGSGYGGRSSVTSNVGSKANQSPTSAQADIEAATRSISDLFSGSAVRSGAKAINDPHPSMAMSTAMSAPTVSMDPTSTFGKTNQGFSMPGTPGTTGFGLGFDPSSQIDVQAAQALGVPSISGDTAVGVIDALAAKSVGGIPGIGKAITGRLDTIDSTGLSRDFSRNLTGSPFGSFDTEQTANLGMIDNQMSSANMALSRALSGTPISATVGQKAITDRLPGMGPATRGLVAQAPASDIPAPPSFDRMMGISEQFGDIENDIQRGIISDMQAAATQRAINEEAARNREASFAYGGSPNVSPAVSAPPDAVDPGPPAQFDRFAPTISRVAEMSANPTLGAMLGTYSSVKAGMANVRNNADPQGMTGGDGGVRYQTAAAMQPPATPTPPPMPDDWWQRWRSRWGYEGLLGNPRDVINEGLI